MAPVGPLDQGTRYVSARAELAPLGDGSDVWIVRDGGEEVFRTHFNQLRASVLWKADVYMDEEERQRLERQPLSHDDVVRIFNDDLSRRETEFRLDRQLLEDPAHIDMLRQFYPEAVPVGACKSMFD